MRISNRQRWILVAVFGTLALAPPRAMARWRRYDNCRLIDKAFYDGDSFYVRCGRRQHIFRLYFVDTPETDLSFPERVAAQAAYWGLNTPQTLQLAKDASQFTRAYLAAPFTVYTQNDDARGNSDQPRYYAMIKTQAGFLSEALVSNGLARVYGKPTTLPNKQPAAQYWKRLHRAEKHAQRMKRGGWATWTQTGKNASWDTPAKYPRAD